MARFARVVLPGYPHHVTQRGNRRQKTFFSEGDYRAYLALLRRACREQETQVWAWCLMPNHVHLVLVPSREDGLRATLGEMHRRYTSRINTREGWRGHLWQERFHSVPLDERYLLATVRYVERNPVEAGLAPAPPDWPWSSASARLQGISDGIITLEPLQSMIPDWPDYWACPREQDRERIRQHTRTGRPLGSEAFLDQAERIAGRRLRPAKPGPRPARNGR